MDIRAYTNKKYIALTDLSALGEDFLLLTRDYRKNFRELVSLGNMEFASLVETPELVKKRFIKNMELVGRVNIHAPDNDFVLEMAKTLVSTKTIEGFVIPDADKIIAKYLENDKDLTIVTNFLQDINVEELNVTKTNMKHLLPELTQNDQKFISNYHDIGLNYSINDYQEITGCSYETGRKSLDKLVELQLYEKTKVGKKFVYQPTTKLNWLLERGET